MTLISVESRAVLNHRVSKGTVCGDYQRTYALTVSNKKCRPENWTTGKMDVFSAIIQEAHDMDEQITRAEHAEFNRRIKTESKRLSDKDRP